MNFEQYLQGKDLSKATIKQYAKEVQRYRIFLRKRGKTPQRAVKKDILDYLNNKNRPIAKYKKTTIKELTNRTKQQILGTLNHLYNHLSQEQGIQNITQFIKIRGVKRKYLHDLFNAEELEGLCDVLYYQTHKQKEPGLLAQSNYILLTLIVYQALNTHEVNRLTKDSFDLRKATVTIEKTKRTNGRTLSLEAAQIGILLNYFNENETANFITSRGYIDALHKQLRKLHPKYNNFAQLRASIITHWIKIYGLRKAQYMAGHRYISSTENYLHNDFESLQNDLNNFHPLN